MHIGEARGRRHSLSYGKAEYEAYEHSSAKMCPKSKYEEYIQGVRTQSFMHEIFAYFHAPYHTIMTYESPQRIQCKKVAVVVLGYNSRDYLQRFFPTLEATTYEDCTMVYVDNASEDDSIDYVSSHHPSFEIFKVPINRGFTSGYESSLPYIDAEYYVLINSDVRVEPTWLSEMMSVIDADSSIGAAQPRLRHEPKPGQFDYGGAAGGFIDRWGYTFCRGRLFHHIEEDQDQYTDQMDIFWATGACMLIKADLYHQLGGLDDHFYAHMEEIDLCWRLKNHGYRIVVVPSSIAYHVGGSIIKYGSFSKLYHNYRNNLIMMYKNLPKGKVWGTIVMRLVLDQVAAMRSLLTGGWTEWRAIMKADWDFLTKLGRWSKCRAEAQTHVRTPDTSGRYAGSLIWDVFVRGIKTFDQLDSTKISS